MLLVSGDPQWHKTLEMVIVFHGQKLWVYCRASSNTWIDQNGFTIGRHHAALANEMGGLRWITEDLAWFNNSVESRLAIWIGISWASISAIDVLRLAFSIHVLSCIMPQGLMFPSYVAIANGEFHKDFLR